MQRTKLKNYLHLHVLVFIWGFTAILGALIHIDAIPLVWYRMGFAVLILGLFFLFSNRSIKVTKKTLLKFLITGALIALHWIFFFAAIKVANVSIALVTMSTGALFTAIIEPFFFKRRFKLIELLFGLIVISGLYLIFNVESSYTLGIIYGLIATFLFALFTTINGLFVQEHDAGKIAFYQMFFGVGFITLFMMWNSGFSKSNLSLTTNDLIYLLILSSVCTAYAFTAGVRIMKHLTPYTVILTTNLEPIYGILLAVLLFGDKEKMTPQFYLGAVIILVTVIVNGLMKTKKNKIQGEANS